MTGHKIEFRSTGATSAEVTSIEIRQEVDDLPRVAITMWTEDVVVNSEDAQVEIRRADPETVGKDVADATALGDARRRYVGGYPK